MEMEGSAASGHAPGFPSPLNWDLLPASHLPLRLLVPRIQDPEEGQEERGKRAESSLLLGLRRPASLRLLQPIPLASPPLDASMPSGAPAGKGCPLSSAGARQARCWGTCADQSCFCWSRPQGGPHVGSSITVPRVLEQCTGLSGAPWMSAGWVVSCHMRVTHGSSLSLSTRGSSSGKGALQGRHMPSRRRAWCSHNPIHTHRCPRRVEHGREGQLLTSPRASPPHSLGLPGTPEMRGA